MQNRLTDYRFDMDKLIEFKGNASPYLQYQYARIRSIFREGSEDFHTFAAPIVLAHDAEQSLGRVLAAYPDVVHEAAETYQPHLLCDHVYRVATAASRFYESCPVLKAEGAERASRLALAALAGRQIEAGLALLGIGTLPRM